MENAAFYASTDSILNRIDPRIKILSVFGFVAIISSLTTIQGLAPALLLMLAVIPVAGIGFLSIARRLLWVLPFAGVMVVLFPFLVPGEAAFTLSLGPLALEATREGLHHAAVLSLRILTAVLAINILVLSTGFRNLTAALVQLKVPVVLIQIVEFTVRYIFVLTDELQRMRVARKARGFEAGRSLFSLHTYRTLGLLIGVLFVRSWERGERIHQAMLARCYSGKGETGKEQSLKTADLCWGFTVVAVAVSLHLAERMVF